MGKIVYVTRAEVLAAQWTVERAAKTGQPVSEAVRKIAEAKPEPVETDPES